jgi:hypothetical protein
VIQRKKRLPKSTKPIRARKKDPTKRRFNRLRDPAYQEWIRQQPCVLASANHYCLGPIQSCHVRTRSTGAPDRGNCFPCCLGGHSLQHSIGLRPFEKRFDLDLSAVAAQLDVQYESEKA